MAAPPDTAEDVAKLAVYLASDDAEMATGSMQVLDGGYTAGYGIEAPQG